MDTKRDPRGGNGREARPRRQMAFNIGFLLTSLLAVWLIQEFVVSTVVIQTREIPYSEFREKLKAGQLVEITIGSPRITGAMKNPAPTSDRDKTIAFDTVAPPNGDPKLLDELDSAGVKYRVKPPASPSRRSFCHGCCRCCCSAPFGTRLIGEPVLQEAASSASGRARPRQLPLARSV